jgi:hypothetical protein
MAAANANMRFTQTNDIVSTKREYRSCAGIRIWIHRLSFVRAGVGNFQNVQQLDNSEKIGFQPNIGLGF